VGRETVNKHSLFGLRSSRRTASPLRCGLPPRGLALKEIEIEIGRAMEQLPEWYTLLIQTSNAVFQVEYRTRNYDVSETAT
jgi:hypothetical protein